MASVREAVTKATRRLGEMTLSQRLAIGLGALLVVASLIWLGQWAATSEMVPLLPGQSLDSEELSLLCAGLDALREPYEIAGSQVLVRAAANRQAVLASLQQAEKLPADTAIGFAELVKEANPWISQEENSRRWTVALQGELARVLREFSGVKQARVLLNLNAKPRGFARSQPESTAGVTLFMSGGETVPRALALAAARMVAGAVRGLPVRNVQVIDGGNGRVALDWDDSEGGGTSSLHRQRQQLEREKETQIKEQLSFDRHALVSVSYELDYTSLQVEDSAPSEGVLVKEETDNTTTARSRAAGQPGVQANVGLTVGADGAGGESATSERRESVYTPGTRTSTQKVPAGAIKQVTAAVSLSHSYLAGVYHHNNPDAGPPAEAQIEEVFARQKEQIAAHVAKLLIPSEPQQVSVVWHYDVLEPETAAEAGVVGTSVDMVQRYGPASGLALLALLALGLMMRMARRRDSGEAFGMEIGLPKEAVEAAKRAAEKLATARARPAATGAPSLGALAGMAGSEEEAGRAIPIPVGQGVESVLEAREVDEGAVRVSRMVQQVGQMVEKDRENVATLVESWISQGR